MIEIIELLVVITLLGGIVVVLKKGFAEIVTGLESLDERLSNIEKKLDKDK